MITIDAKHIGYMPVDYTDPETGEVISGYWSPAPYRQFHKHELETFINAMAMSTDKALHVLAYLLSLMNPSTNTVKATYTSVAKGMRLANSTVIECFSALQERDNIRMVQRGLWMINPRLDSKGYEDKTMKQIGFYESLETLTDRRLKNKERMVNKDA